MAYSPEMRCSPQEAELFNYMLGIWAETSEPHHVIYADTKENLTSQTDDDVRQLLSELRSLLAKSMGDYETLLAFHNQFPDFLAQINRYQGTDSLKVKESAAVLTVIAATLHAAEYSIEAVHEVANRFPQNDRPYIAGS